MTGNQEHGSLDPVTAQSNVEQCILATRRDVSAWEKHARQNKVRKDEDAHEFQGLLIAAEQFGSTSACKDRLV
jgi:hypothetical protein